MNIYLISQDQNIGYDTYDACVVAAESETIARNITPDGRFGSSWASSPEYVNVKLIGVAIEEIKTGVILESFNAG